MEIYRHNKKVESYVFGKLNAQDAQELENSAKQDDELSELIHLYQLEYRGLELLLQNQLRKKMEGWEANRRRVKILPHNWSKYFKFYLLAASVAILVLSMWFLSVRHTETTYFELASGYAPKLEQDVRGIIQEDFFDEGLQFFNDSNYQAAISFFSNCDTDMKEGNKCRILLAHSHFLNGLAEKSREELKLAQKLYTNLESSSTVKEIRENAEWYNCLVSLALGKVPIQRLEKISNDQNHLFYLPSKKLNEDL